LASPVLQRFSSRLGYAATNVEPEIISTLMPGNRPSLTWLDCARHDAPCIEHGHLMDEETAKLMADKGVWLSTQPFVGEDDQEPLTGQARSTSRSS